MANLQQFLRNLNVLGEKRDPVRSLWRNVLIVALEDALGKHWKNKNIRVINYPYLKSARDYFTEPNRDFKTVCEFAGFDHEYIRMKAKKVFERDRHENNLH
tara:strand:+ start:316 stop:618 length:303 start_codon:yes stop_codon:yes gene_type:complete